jgi:hypothetical protein
MDNASASGNSFCLCDWEYSSFFCWTDAFSSVFCTSHLRDKSCKYWSLCWEDVHNLRNACINSTARRNRTCKWNRSCREDPMKMNLWRNAEASEKLSIREVYTHTPAERTRVLSCVGLRINRNLFMFAPFLPHLRGLFRHFVSMDNVLKGWKDAS